MKRYPPVRPSHIKLFCHVPTNLLFPCCLLSRDAARDLRPRDLLVAPLQINTTIRPRCGTNDADGLSQERVRATEASESQASR